MKAFVIDRYGSGERVRAGDMPEPVMHEDDVLVQIHAAGVNVLDAKIKSGEFKRLLPYRLPLILGNDVAGVVLKVGARVRRFKPGAADTVAHAFATSESPCGGAGAADTIARQLLDRARFSGGMRVAFATDDGRTILREITRVNRKSM